MEGREGREGYWGAREGGREGGRGIFGKIVCVLPVVLQDAPPGGMKKY